MTTTPLQTVSLAISGMCRLGIAIGFVVFATVTPWGAWTAVVAVLVAGLLALLGIYQILLAATAASDLEDALDRPDEAFDLAVTALHAAADGLASAANQFAAMRESQEAGHYPEVHNNPEKFAEKETAARAVLAELGAQSSPSPAVRDSLAGEQAAGLGGGLPHRSPAGASAAGAPSASDAGDGATPPRDAAPAGGPADALATLLVASGGGAGTAELRAVRLLKGLNEAGYHVLRESEVDAVATAEAVS